MNQRTAGVGEESREGARGKVKAEITTAIVRLHKECFGKGPTKATTAWEDEVVTVLLRDGFTPDELTLIEAGEFEAVHQHRQRLHQALRERFIAAVEETTGRKVVAFMSGVQAEDPPAAAEVFVLEPEHNDMRSRRLSKPALPR